MMKKILKKIEQNILPDKFSCSLKYRIAFGKWIDWKNPKTWTEKVQWRKIYDRNPLYTKLADRYAVREYVEEKVGEKYLIPLLFVGQPRDIPFDSLKPPFVIKTTHNVGKHLFIKTKKDYERMDKKRIINYFSRCLNSNYYPIWREWQYKDIEPGVVIEKLILDENRIPDDYKFHCFNGEPKNIQIISGRDKKQTYESNYNLNWEPKGFILTYPPHQKKLEKPKNFNHMIKIASKLSEDFDYMRVDLYNINKKIYFGEYTVTPEAGFLKFKPKKWDAYFGKLWKLKNKKKT